MPCFTTLSKKSSAICKSCSSASVSSWYDESMDARSDESLCPRSGVEGGADGAAGPPPETPAPEEAEVEIDSRPSDLVGVGVGRAAAAFAAAACACACAWA
uniref:Uncharacterized protein n=1 Tax=Trieres chinensis TaxID=1514140 RepID=A0A7S2EPY5_TRICV